jgi:hypothetical protein
VRVSSGTRAGLSPNLLFIYKALRHVSGGEKSAAMLKNINLRLQILIKKHYICTKQIEVYADDLSAVVSGTVRTLDDAIVTTNF